MNTALYETYVQILHEELVPAMGCTEPIAVAYAGALARQTLGTLPERIELTVSGNIIKNVKSVIVPHTGGRKGLPVAVAAGVRVGDADAQLEVLANVTEDQLPLLDEYLSAAEITVSKSPLRCPFDIQVRVFAGGDTAFVQIVGSHTNVVRIEKNGEVLFQSGEAQQALFRGGGPAAREPQEPDGRGHYRLCRRGRFRRCPRAHRAPDRI